MARSIAGLVLGVALLMPAAPGLAGPVFDINAITLLSINNGQPPTFAPDDVLTGSIELSDRASMPGAVLGPSDILSFSIMVGMLSFTTANTAAPEFRAIVSDMGDSLSFFRLLFSSADASAGCGGMCRVEFGRFATARNVVNVIDLPAVNLFRANFALQRRGGQVSEPASLALLGLGILGLARVRGRRAA